jgi:hypothetical protein
MVVTMNEPRALLAAAFAAMATMIFATSPVAAAAPLQLPPLTQPATSEHHVGKVIWTDLVTPDLEAAKRFYGGLFGWTFREIDTAAPREYTVALLDGRPVAGLVHRPAPPGEPKQPAWLTFIAVKDFDAARRIALSHGGKLLADARTYPKRGRQAVFSDPGGATFALLASSSGDPPDFLAAPGEWIWSSLLVRDPDADAAFYQAVFGYDVFDSDSEDGVDHLVLSTDGYARASANALPGDTARRHPHWLNYVRVVDAVEATSKVKELGGRVLVEPRIDRHGGKVAVVADPAGAPFGLLEWTETDSKELTR